ncbi:hypothetical protein AGLY_003030 [Aphis glycines]|uniref:Uncharacterized protein n=1 Tax=Aphis glycines TaxID=307491 RepID=A0A6G0U3B4_APHGL|nr:hypothetical protein AGLY_003030 [Aphis glycines]
MIILYCYSCGHYKYRVICLSMMNTFKNERRNTLYTLNIIILCFIFTLINGENKKMNSAIPYRYHSSVYRPRSKIIIIYKPVVIINTRRYKIKVNNNNNNYNITYNTGHGRDAVAAVRKFTMAITARYYSLLIIILFCVHAERTVVSSFDIRNYEITVPPVVCRVDDQITLDGSMSNGLVSVLVPFSGQPFCTSKSVSGPTSWTDAAPAAPRQAARTCCRHVRPSWSTALALAFIPSCKSEGGCHMGVGLVEFTYHYCIQSVVCTVLNFTLTHRSSCATGRLIAEQARCKGVRKSRWLTTQFTWSALANSLVSYLLRIHNSFSSRLELGLGLVRSGRMLDSHTEFARSLPIAIITLRLRCIPEHSMHMSIPRFKLAQSGFGELQSAHCPFPGTRVRMFCTSSARICCSIAATHSSRSSELLASNCHCLLSNDTIRNSYPSVSKMNLHTFALLVLNVTTLHPPVSLFHIRCFGFEITVVSRQGSVRHADC